MIQYSIVLRGNPQAPEKGKKIHATAQSRKVMDLEEIVNHMKEHGEKYSVGDYKAMISNLTTAMAKLLLDGCKLNLNELGLFSIALRCEGADPQEGFDPTQHIKELKVNWTPGSAFEDLISRATFAQNLDRRTERKVIKEEQQKRAEGIE